MVFDFVTSIIDGLAAIEGKHRQLVLTFTIFIFEDRQCGRYRLDFSKNVPAPDAQGIAATLLTNSNFLETIWPRSFPSPANYAELWEKLFPGLVYPSSTSPAQIWTIHVYIQENIKKEEKRLPEIIIKQYGGSFPPLTRAPKYILELFKEDLAYFVFNAKYASTTKKAGKHLNL